jgi:CheY-like chemotaxis protein
MTTVLIVDDEPDVLEGFGALFEAALDARVLRASSGQAGLQLLQANPVDVIVSDYKMPEMNGLEFLAKAHDLAPGVPALLVTAYPDAELERKARSLGVFRFLSKAVDPDDLVGQVQLAVGSHAPPGGRPPPPPRGTDLRPPERKGSPEGKGDGEGGAAAFPWAVAGDGAAVQVDQPLGHEEPQPGAGLHLV